MSALSTTFPCGWKGQGQNLDGFEEPGAAICGCALAQVPAAASLWVPPASHIPIFSLCSPGHVTEEAVQQAARPRGVAQHPAERRARA